VSIDVLDRTVTDDGRLLTTRLFSSHFTFPKLITSLLGLPEVCYAIERSEVDIKTQKMELKTINYTFGSVLTVNEKLVYAPNKDNPNETLLTQGAKVHIHGIPFADYFEDMIVSRFDATSQLGRRALQKVLKAITVESMLKTVSNELAEITLYADKAACNISSNVTERIDQLVIDLDCASDMINSEIQSFSNKYSEYLNLIGTLNSELSEVVIKINTLVEHEQALKLSANIGLYEAVNKAGISAKTKTL